jgi:hypothetical protein
MRAASWHIGDSPGQLASQFSAPTPPTRGTNALTVAVGESSTISTSGYLRFSFEPIVGIASVSSSAVTNKGNEAN